MKRLHSSRGVHTTPAVSLIALLLSACGAVSWNSPDRSTGTPTASTESTGYSTRAGEGMLSVRWTRRLTALKDGPYEPVELGQAAVDVSRNRVYIGSVSGRLYAFRSNGGRDYDVNLGGAIESAPVVSKDRLFVATEQGAAHCLRASDGKLLWTTAIGTPVRTGGVITGQTVIFAGDNDLVVALDTETGSERWTYQRPLPRGLSVAGHASPVVIGTQVIVGLTDGTVVALEASTGTANWTRETALDLDPTVTDLRFLDVDTTAQRLGNELVVASFAAGIYGLDVETGSVRWRMPEMTGVTQLSLEGDILYVAAAQTGVSAIRLPSRDKVWNTKPLGGAPTGLAVTSHCVVFGEAEGGLVCLDPYDGKELDRITGNRGFSAAPVLAQGMGFSLSNGGTLYALNVR